MQEGADAHSHLYSLHWLEANGSSLEEARSEDLGMLLAQNRD